jgi:lysophospholipase L1-like esterase
VELQQVVEADPSNYGIAHPYIGNLQTPNNAFVISGRDYHAVHHTDGYGFRNSWPWPKTTEIVALGDSVVFGQGVEDQQAWPAVLARSFPNSRVINLGLIGAGPQQYLRVYESFGLKLHPKVVLVGFFMGNDFWDADMFDRWVKSGTQVNYMVWRDYGKPISVSLTFQQSPEKLKSALLWRARLFAGRFYLFNLVVHALRNLMIEGTSEIKTFRAPDGALLQWTPAIFANNTKQAHPGDQVFLLVVDALQRIQSLAKQDGATVLVVVQPSKQEVYSPLLGESRPDAAAPLRAALEKRGIPYIDVLEDFRRRAAEGEVLFFETDGHPNAKGYALIGDLVSSYLKQHAKEYGL